MVTLGLVAALLTATAGCSFIGDIVEQQQVTPQENRKYEKEVAQRFIKYQPDVEVITYTSKGHVLGSGEWSAGAVVTIGGKQYEQILGAFSFGGDPLPATPTSFSPSPVTVNYSDGTSEVLR